ncbi:MAG: response regulator [Chloroflexota bacterium]
MPAECILVIDDSADIRAFLREKVLEPAGYMVLTASDGQSGLERALAERPDLIMLDVNMPRMTGIEVLEALQKEKARVPVILMTFYGSETVAVQAFRLGVKDYLRKPFEIDEVMRSIERALNESRLQRDKETLLQRLETTNKQLEQRVTELTTLYAVGQSVTSLLDLDKLLNRVVEAAVYIADADEGSLLLVDDKTNELYLRAAQGMGERQARGLRIRIKDSLVGSVVRTGEPLLATGSPESDDLLKVKTGYLVGSLLYAPLKVKGRVIGVLGVINRTPSRKFGQDNLFRLTSLADYAAIAIENARLHEASRQLVAMDILKQTVVTVAHYINNPLAALVMQTQILLGDLESNRIEDVLRFIEMKAEEISAVIGILQEMAAPRSTTYLGNVKMIDIQAELDTRLQQIQKKYQH